MKIYQIFLKKYLKKKILREIVQIIAMVQIKKEPMFPINYYVVLKLNIMEIAMINVHQEQKYFLITNVKILLVLIIIIFIKMIVGLIYMMDII